MDGKRKAVIVGFIIFLLAMGICGLVTKGIYAAGLPRVTDVSPREMSLYHPVSAVGAVDTGQEYGVYAPSGLRVASIAVQKGDSFQEGDHLLQLDVEDLKLILAEKELNRQRELLRQRETESQSDQNRRENQQALDRALEDWERARQTGELQTGRAGEELNRAQTELERLRKELEQTEKELERARRSLKQAEKEQVGNGGQNGQTGKGAFTVSGGDNGSAEADLSAIRQQCGDLEAAVRQLQERISQQEQTVIAAFQAAEDAHLDYADGMRDAQRSVQDAQAARDGGYQAAVDLAELELSVLAGEIRELQELIDGEGWICARESGRVTQLCVGIGQRTPDTAQLLYTPDDGQRRIQARLTEEQSKYVSVGTRMQMYYETVSLGKQSKEGIVGYMEPQEDGSTLIWLDVTGQGMELGQQVTLKSTWQSENYSLVVPLSALHKDGNNSDFVYILRQQNGILGVEWHASILYVDVADQNGSYAAVESAALSNETRIVLTTSADLKDNAVVRIVE